MVPGESGLHGGGWQGSQPTAAQWWSMQKELDLGSGTIDRSLTKGVLVCSRVHVAVRRGLAERGTADSNTPYIVGAGVLSLAAVYAGVKFASPPVNNKSASPKSTTTTPTESASVDGEATPVQPKSPAPVETPVVETPVVEVKPPPPPPLEVPYVIVGGGTAAYFAMRGIRARDKTAKVSRCLSARAVGERAKGKERER